MALKCPFSNGAIGWSVPDAGAARPLRWLQASTDRGDRDAEIEDFIEGFNQPTYRGMRVNGQRVATWSCQHGWSGDGRPDAEWIH
jgi:hypothetical protein